MWRLGSVRARNLLSFAELEYSLNTGVTTLVFGQNLDNDSQQSNGSGKSALIECIAIGVTGTPLRRVRIDEVINDQCDRCFVGLSFVNEELNEVFGVERVISRKDAPVIRCYFVHDDVTQEIKRPGVEEYNRYVLEVLGISKEELFNNFILSKHKFRDFLDASDREKKEIINKFSNGNLVDEAIGRLRDDVAPVETELNATSLEEANLEGRIDMLSEQIAREVALKTDWLRSKEERLRETKVLMTEKRKAKRACKEEIVALNSVLDDIESVEERLKSWDESDLPLEKCYSNFLSLGKAWFGISDYAAMIGDKKAELSSLEEERDSCLSLIGEAEKKAEAYRADYELCRGNYDRFATEVSEKSEEMECRIAEVEKKLNDLQSYLASLNRTKRGFLAAIEGLQANLSGVIVCPKCRYEFLVSDRDFDVDAAKSELDGKRIELDRTVSDIHRTGHDLECVEDERTGLMQQQSVLSVELRKCRKQLDDVDARMNEGLTLLDSLKRKGVRLTDRIASLQCDLASVRGRMFDEGFDLCDSHYQVTARKIERKREETAVLEGSLSSLSESLKEIEAASGDELVTSLRESLRESLLKYREKYNLVATNRATLESRFNSLIEQEQRFNLYKTYLANLRIEALGGVTNDFLAAIGSDIRIKYTGYTLLKSGKIKEKISISLIRDGIDCGSFGKFSEGEKARVNLATILAMHKLITINCSEFRGLDLVVLDEILEAVDEDGLASIFTALNGIGITTLVVSHGNVAENYPHKLVVYKENGVSRINNYGLDAF